MPSQRPYFLSSFLAAFRPQGPSIPPTTQHSQPTKHSHAQPSTTSSTSSAARATAAATNTSQPSHSSVEIRTPRGAASPPSGSNVASSPGGGIPIPSRRRGSDSSSEGFREVLGADKWYIGGRTPGGEEKFFKMGVIRRMRSSDGLSLDRLSL